jgi:hypothetical protein
MAATAPPLLMPDQQQSITQSQMVLPPALPATGMMNQRAVPGSAAALPESQRLDEGLLPAPDLISYYEKRAANDAAIKKALGDAHQETTGIGPHLLATAAALTGNFGPAIQLSEQKRKTAQFKQAYPVLTQIADFRNRGEWDAARQLSEQAVGQLGDRSPELSALFTQTAQQSAKKQEDWAALKNLYDMAKITISPNDPVQGPYLKALAIAVKNQTPMSEILLNNFAQRNAPVTQFAGGYLLRGSPGSGQVTQTPIREAAQPGQEQDYVGNMLTRKYKLNSTEEITNLLRDVPAKRIDGSIIEPGTSEAEAILADRNKELATRANLQLAPLIPFDPARTIAMAENPNIGPLTIAQRFANVTPEERARQVGESQEHYENRQAQMAAKTNILVAEKTPFGGASANAVAMDVSPDSATFGTTHPAMSKAEVDASGGRFRFVSLDSAKQVQVAQNAVTGLNYVVPLFKALGTGDLKGQQWAAAAINRWATDLTNGKIDFTQNGYLTAKAAQEIVNRSIEELGETKLISDKDVGMLKNLATGVLANEDTVMQGITFMQERINQRIARLSGGAVSTLTPGGQQGGTMTESPQAVPSIVKTTPSGTTSPGGVTVKSQERPVQPNVPFLPNGKPRRYFLGR